jgi:hypothetical protein
MKTPKRHFNARWASPSLASLANITIIAKSPAGAIQSARREAKRFGYTSTPFMLHEGARLIHHGL